MCAPGIDDLIAAVINSIKLYVKPEEYAAYYVVNDSYFGKVKM